MVSTNELIVLINMVSLTERIKIVEEVLRGIREEKGVFSSEKDIDSKETPKILELAGKITEKEAAQYIEAVEESRKIDQNEN